MTTPTQTASVVDAHGNLHDWRGRFARKLSGRVSLGPGETLSDADVFAANGTTIPMALVQTPAGPRLRIGVGILEEDRDRWRAADRGATASLPIGQAVAFADALRSMETATAAGRAEYDQIDARYNAAVERRRRLVASQYPELDPARRGELDALDDQIELASKRLELRRVQQQESISDLDPAAAQRYTELGHEIKKAREERDRALHDFYDLGPGGGEPPSLADPAVESAYNRYRQLADRSRDLSDEQTALFETPYGNFYERRAEEIDDLDSELRGLADARNELTGPATENPGVQADITAAQHEIDTAIEGFDAIEDRKFAEGLIRGEWNDVAYETTVGRDDGEVTHRLDVRPHTAEDDWFIGAIGDATEVETDKLATLATMIMRTAGQQTAAVVDAQGNLHDARGRFTRRFGFKSGLAEVLRESGQLGDDTDDDLELEAAQFGDDLYVDWSTRRGDDYQIDFQGPAREPDEDDEDDEGSAGYARLFVSPSEFRRMANGISIALMLEEIGRSPLPDGHPMRPYIAALVADDSRVGHDFEDSAWDQGISWYFLDGQWKINAHDEDGDSAEISLTHEQMKTLHAKMNLHLMQVDRPENDGDQTAAVRDRLGNLHDRRGRFTEKSGPGIDEALSSGAADALAHMDRRQLLKAAKDRGLELPPRATPDQIKQALAASEPKPAIPGASPRDTQRAALGKLKKNELLRRAADENINIRRNALKPDIIEAILNGPDPGRSGPQDNIHIAEARRLAETGGDINGYLDKKTRGVVDQMMDDLGVPAKGRGRSNAERRATVLDALGVTATHPAGRGEFDPGAVAADLNGAQTREEADGILSDLTTEKLRSVAAAAGASLTGVTRKDQIRGRIVEQTVGHRLNTRTLERTQNLAHAENLRPVDANVPATARRAGPVAWQQSGADAGGAKAVVGGRSEAQLDETLRTSSNPAELKAAAEEWGRVTGGKWHSWLNAYEGNFDRMAADNRGTGKTLGARAIADRVSELGTEAEIVDALKGQTGPNLRRVASELGIKIHASMTDKDELKAHIARSLVAFGSSPSDSRANTPAADIATLRGELDQFRIARADLRQMRSDGEGTGRTAAQERDLTAMIEDLEQQIRNAGGDPAEPSPRRFGRRAPRGGDTGEPPRVPSRGLREAIPRDQLKPGMMFTREARFGAVNPPTLQVVRFERRHRSDGMIVAPVNPNLDEGTMNRWVAFMPGERFYQVDKDEIEFRMDGPAWRRDRTTISPEMADLRREARARGITVRPNMNSDDLRAQLADAPLDIPDTTTPTRDLHEMRIRLHELRIDRADLRQQREDGNETPQLANAANENDRMIAQLEQEIRDAGGNPADPAPRRRTPVPVQAWGLAAGDKILIDGVERTMTHPATPVGGQVLVRSVANDHVREDLLNPNDQIGKLGSGDPPPLPSGASPLLSARSGVAHNVAGLLSQLDSAMWKGASDRALKHHITAMANQSDGLFDKAEPGTADRMRAAVDAGDRDGLAAILTEVAERHQLRPYGRAGDIVTFDRDSHRPSSEAEGLREGDPAQIVRTSYAWQEGPINAIRLERPTVSAPNLAAAAEISARNRQARIDSMRNRAEVLAELERDIVDIELDPEVQRRGTRDAAARLGIEFDPAIQSVIDAIGDDGQATLHAVSDAAERLGLTRVSPAGTVERFSRARHETLPGSRIGEGSMVRVIRPGYTMPDDGRDLLIVRPLVEADNQTASAARIECEEEMRRDHEFHPGHVDQSVHGRKGLSMPKAPTAPKAPRSVKSIPPQQKPAGPKKKAQAQLLQHEIDEVMEKVRFAKPDDVQEISGLIAGVGRSDLMKIAKELDIKLTSTAANNIRNTILNKISARDGDKPAAPPKAHRFPTSTQRSEALDRGDVIFDDDGVEYRMVAQPMSDPDDPTVVILQVVDREGNRRELKKGRKQRVDRATGVRAGGGGTFSTGTPTFAPAVIDALFQGRMPEEFVDYYRSPEGLAKLRPGVRGFFKRCQRELADHGVPPHMIDGACSNLHVKLTGQRPSRHAEHAANQVACACGEPAAPDMRVSDIGPPGSIGWFGPLAPVDRATGDRRRIAAGALDSRPFPLPFRWQQRQESGHDGAVVVGAMTGYGIAPDGLIRAKGYWLDPEVIPEVEQAMYLVKHKLVGPSVDLAPDMDVALVDPSTGNTFDPHTCGIDGSCPTKAEALITRGTIVAATLVPITAFAEARAPELFTIGVDPDPILDPVQAAPTETVVSPEMAAGCGCPDQVASAQFGPIVLDGVWDRMPIAPLDTEWDPAAARDRLMEWSGMSEMESEEDVWGDFGLGHLYQDGPGYAVAEYQFQIVDILQGRPHIVPAAVFAAAARLGSANIAGAARPALRQVITDLYGQIGEEFADSTVTPPWETGDCGCADKWANQTASAAATTPAYGVFGDMAPYPSDAFNVNLTGYTPVTIEQRPGEDFARVYGHFTSWQTCNRGVRGKCLPAPRSKSGYAQFHLGGARTTDGILPVGKIVMGEGHPDLGFGAKITRAFYDATSKTVAFVRAEEDEFGGKFAGVLAPGITPEEATMLLASPLSPDWRDHEMIALLAVNTPGHVIPRAHVRNGQVVSQVASVSFYHDHDDDLTEDAEGVLIENTFAMLGERLWEAEAVTLAETFSSAGKAV